jgi:hypothetical protein
MERSNKPPPLSIPANPPAYLSALSYHRTPSGHGMPSAWTTARRRNLRKTFAPCGNTAGVLFIAFLVMTGTLTWLLIRGGNSSSPLSRIPIPNNDPSTRIDTAVAAQKIPDKFPVRELDEVREPGKANSTLNFQQIFAINLPSRLDRKDTLTLMASYSNLSITIVPGVRTLAENALPPPRTPGSVRAEEYAVWRAHANVWRRIIEDGLTTALILEDDNDWDVNLKEQIPRIMKALDEIRVAPPREEEDGVVRSGREEEGWDMLYLGSCWETATLKDKHNRKTVVPIPSDRENVAKNNYNWVPSPFPSPILGSSSLLPQSVPASLPFISSRVLTFFIRWKTFSVITNF